MVFIATNARFYCANTTICFRYYKTPVSASLCLATLAKRFAHCANLEHSAKRSSCRSMPTASINPSRRQLFACLATLTAYKPPISGGE